MTAKAAAKTGTKMLRGRQARRTIATTAHAPNVMVATSSVATRISGRIIPMVGPPTRSTYATTTLIPIAAARSTPLTRAILAAGLGDPASTGRCSGDDVPRGDGRTEHDLRDREGAEEGPAPAR